MLAASARLLDDKISILAQLQFMVLSVDAVHECHCVALVTISIASYTQGN